MQAAAPLMSTFIIYLIGISTSIFSFRKFKSSIKSSKYVIASIFLGLSFLSFSFLILRDNKTAIANSLFGLDETYPIDSNAPIGEAKGLFPGRVVWVHDTRATNENYNPASAGSNWWNSNTNTNEDIVRDMLETGIKKYAAEEDIVQAWTAIFTSFNESHGNGSTAYTPGEKIAIKINLTNQCCVSASRMDATPQLVKAILYELVVNVGVAEKDIILGDPYREFRQEYKTLVKAFYPDVKYVDGKGGDGIYQTSPSTGEVLVFSDKKNKSTLPSQYLIAKYLINIPCLKTHNEGGITLIAKNHQGSYLAKGESPQDQYAIAMHYSLPKNSPGTRKYRHTVDYMSHEDTGGKGLIYIIDGIWGGENWEGQIKKFVSDPFNGDYPNSIFVGQDPVAMESVGFDILFEEYVEDNNKKPYPIEMKDEIADYLKQCASSDYWPDGITYDPEGDGTPIGSQGVFEHWDNAVDRQYSRNLGTGDGIELVYVTPEDWVGVKNVAIESILNVGPNPFSSYTSIL